MIENLAFSGGGVKCITYIGILKFLEEQNIIKNIKHIAGTSGGAIFALMLILGYTYNDLKSLITGLDFEQLRDVNSDNIFQFFNNFGIDTGNKLEYLIKLLISKKMDTKCEDITLLDLYSKFNIKFTITGTCLDEKCIHYFNHELTPQMKLITAIRITYSIPIVYNRVVYNNMTYIDGGILENYPIEIFKDNLKNTYGFYLSGESFKNSPITSIDIYMLSVLISLAKKIENSLLEQYLDNTIIFNCDFSPIDFNLNNEQKINAINKGYNTTKKFFENIINKSEDIKTQEIEEDTNSETDISSNNSEINLENLNNIEEIKKIDIQNMEKTKNDEFDFQNMEKTKNDKLDNQNMEQNDTRRIVNLYMTNIKNKTFFINDNN